MAILVQQRDRQRRRRHRPGADIAQQARHHQRRASVLQRRLGAHVLDGEPDPVHRQADAGIGAGRLRPQAHHVDPEHHRGRHQHGQRGPGPGPDHALDHRLARAPVGLGLGAEHLGKLFAGNVGRRAIERVVLGRLGGRGGLGAESAFLGGDPELERWFNLGFPRHATGRTTHRTPIADGVVIDEIAGGAVWTGQYHGRRIGRCRTPYRGRRFLSPCPERQTPSSPAPPTAATLKPSFASKTSACAMGAHPRC